MKIVVVFIALTCSLIFSLAASGAVREYHLNIARQDITIQGKTGVGMTINGAIPGPTLRFQEGDLARVQVTNMLPVSTSIHWHGMLVPPDMDGVPFITQVPIAPGSTHTYEFPIRQTGTYWYHSHSELQEQSGLYGAIVIEDDQMNSDREHVVLLSDWTTDSPDSVLRTLKRGSEWYSLQKGSAQSILGAARAGKLGDYFMRELQRMPPMDLADVAYDFFLSNGKPVQNLAAEGGDRIRLRIINGSATTYFHVNFSGGPMTIISADGQLVNPVEQDLFLIGVAETYDVLVTVPEAGAYEFRATAHDGSGFTSTWLGAGEEHPARAVPRPELYETMMAHGAAGSVFALTPAGSMGMSDQLVEQGEFDKPGMEHQMTGEAMGHSMNGQGARDTTMSHGHAAHGAMAMDKTAGPEKKKTQGAENMAMEHGHMGNTDTPGGSGHDMHKKDPIPQSHSGAHVMPAAEQGSASGEKASETISSARSFGGAFGFLETDIASRPDRAKEGSPERPGTPYQLLRAAGPTTVPPDTVVREVRLTLDGDMKRYTWFLNNKPLSETDSIEIKGGEATRFIMINRTMMHHPMHLHGHFFRVLNGQGDYSPLKHTVDVAPMSTTVIEFYNNETGDWFFHCHLLYHMKSGMARLVHYQDFTPAENVAAVRHQLYRDPFSFYGFADASSNMTEGALTLANSRYSLEASWEVGWQGVDETDWEGLLAADYHVNRFTSFFVGADFLGEGSASDEIRGVLGINYLLPLNFDAAAWLDSDGGARVYLAKELEITPRLGLHGEVQYDTHTQWEGKVGLSYLVSKDFSIIGNWHSEYGVGVGLQIRF